MTANFSIKADSHGHYEVITITGELDVYNATWLREASLRAMERGRHHVVIDLTLCLFLDMTGLGAIIGALKRAREHDGSLQVVCTSGPILAKFHLTGVEKVLNIRADLDTALGLREVTS